MDSDCERNIEIVRELFELVEGRGPGATFEEKWAAYESKYGPDVTIHEAPGLPYGGEYLGPDAVARHSQAYRSAWDALQAGHPMEPRFMAAGDQVLVSWRQRGCAPDGKTFDMPAVSVYRLRDGRIAESRMFQFDVGATGDFLRHANAAS
ncbi:MAG: nuclear transport factor 2 family protein [Sphingosinicella sp.]|nr:nuclear transport factor 2 family protein [Sphingosinicella sp.]